MNKGFEMSSGEIIVYLNSDDYFHQGVFKTVIDSFNDEVDIVVGDIEVLNTEGCSKSIKPSIKYYDIIEHWKSLYPLNSLQYFYKRKVQSNVSFNINNHIAMDHEFLLDIYKDFNFSYKNITFGTFNMRRDSKTYEGLRNPEIYWTSENFSYIDRHLEDKDQSYIIGFKNKQHEFFQNSIIESYKLFHEKKLYLNTIKTSVLLNDIIKNSNSIALWGAGSLAVLLFPLIKEKLVKVVDININKINNYFCNHLVEPIDSIDLYNKYTLIVTPLNAKNEILEKLKDFYFKEIIFIEDIIYQNE